MAHRFTYEEETTPEDFFVPLVWSLVVADSLLPWHHAAIALFASQAASRSYSEANERVEGGTPHASKDGTSQDLAPLTAQVNGLDVV